MHDNFEQVGSHLELPLLPPTAAPKQALNMDKLESIKRRLDALPVIQALTTKVAISKLLPSVKKMQQKGYTLDQIASTLRESGLPTSGRNLARLLSSGPPPSRQAT